MWGILHMRVTSLVAVVAPHTYRQNVFEKGDNLLQNDVLHFVFGFS